MLRRYIRDPRYRNQLQQDLIRTHFAAEQRRHSRVERALEWSAEEQPRNQLLEPEPELEGHEEPTALPAYSHRTLDAGGSAGPAVTGDAPIVREITADETPRTRTQFVAAQIVSPAIITSARLHADDEPADAAQLHHEAAGLSEEADGAGGAATTSSTLVGRGVDVDDLMWAAVNEAAAETPRTLIRQFVAAPIVSRNCRY